MPNDQIAPLEISPVRRWVGIGAVAFLGALTLYLALTHPPSSLFGKFLMSLLGVVFLAQAQRNYFATTQGLYLTKDALFWDDGTKFVDLDDVAKVDRGTFGFKPTNGFALVMKERVDADWQPGMFWKVGKRIGIGGSTQPGHAKAVADLISQSIAAR